MKIRDRLFLIDETCYFLKRDRLFGVKDNYFEEAVVSAIEKEEIKEEQAQKYYSELLRATLLESIPETFKCKIFTLFKEEHEKLDENDNRSFLQNTLSTYLKNEDNFEKFKEFIAEHLDVYTKGKKTYVTLFEQTINDFDLKELNELIAAHTLQKFNIDILLEMENEIERENIKNSTPTI